jgi:hypothetical protein
MARTTRTILDLHRRKIVRVIYTWRDVHKEGSFAPAPMQIKDKASLAISLAALLLSVITGVASWITASRTKAAQERQVIYNAYNLGQQASIIYCYAKSGGKSPSVSGQTGDKESDEKITTRTFAAQGYAQSLQVPPDRFLEFRNLLETGKPENVAETFGLLNPNLTAAGGEKALAAYDLGYETILFAVGYLAHDLALEDLTDYPKIRADIDRNLRVLGVSNPMPTTVSDRAGFTEAMRRVITTLNQLKP